MYYIIYTEELSVETKIEIFYKEEDVLLFLDGNDFINDFMIIRGIEMKVNKEFKLEPVEVS